MDSEKRTRQQREAQKRYRIKHPDRIKAAAEERRKSGKLSKYSNARRKQIRAVVSNIKSSTPCADCKQKYHPACIDFDHRENKKAAVSHMISDGYSLQLVLKEIEKCDVVCANCHRLRTYHRQFPETSTSN